MTSWSCSNCPGAPLTRLPFIHLQLASLCAIALSRPVPSSPKANEQDNGINAGAIVGICVSAFLSTALFLFLIFWLRRYYKTRKQRRHLASIRRTIKKLLARKSYISDIAPIQKTNTSSSEVEQSGGQPALVSAKPHAEWTYRRITVAEYPSPDTTSKFFERIVAKRINTIFLLAKHDEIGAQSYLPKTDEEEEDTNPNCKDEETVRKVEADGKVKIQHRKRITSSTVQYDTQLKNEKRALLTFGDPWIIHKSIIERLLEIRIRNHNRETDAHNMKHYSCVSWTLNGPAVDIEMLGTLVNLALDTPGPILLIGTTNDYRPLVFAIALSIAEDAIHGVEPVPHIHAGEMVKNADVEFNYTHYKLAVALALIAMRLRVTPLLSSDVSRDIDEFYKNI